MVWPMWVIQLVVWAVTTIIGAAITKVPKGGPPVGLDKFQRPTATEDRSIPVLLGTGWLKGPNCTALCDLKPTPIKQNAGRKYAFFGPMRKTIINYLYAMGVHFVFCRRANKILKIRLGEKDVPMAEVTGNTVRNFNLPNLFGGDKAGGGLVGNLSFEFGGPAQPVNSYLASKLTGPVSAHRGVVGITIQGARVTAAPPGQGAYVPHLQVLARNVEGETAWYPEKCAVGTYGINPAHALRLLLTRQAWNNSRYSDGDMGESFVEAADTLHAEGFGMRLIISDDDLTAEDAIAEIKRHVDGSVYEDKITGKVEFRLNRGGYDIESLPHFTEGVGEAVESVESYTRTGWGDRINTLSVSYYDVEQDRDRTTTPVHDPQGIENQGGIVSVNIPFGLLLDGDVAVRCTERELRQRSADLGVATLLGNRRMSGLNIGSLFRWTSPSLGVFGIVMRVQGISYGSMANGQVRIQAIEDIFSLPEATYTKPPPSQWQPIVNDPLPAISRRVLETPFYFTGPGVFQPETDGTFTALALPPTQDALSFDASAGGEIVGTELEWSESAVLSAPIGPADTLIAVSAGITTTGYALIDDEIVHIDAAGGVLLVRRNMLDTVPAKHLAGAAVMTFPDNAANEPYSDGQVVSVKMLTTTLRGQLSEAAAPVNTVTMARRHVRPYPVANLRVNATAYPAEAYGALVATWFERNRLTHTDPQPTDPSVPPEAGTTCVARWYVDNVLKRTQAGITSSTDTFTPDVGSGGKTIRLEIETVRGSYTSWQRATHEFLYRAQLVTEAGDRIVTEEGDPIILE